MKFRLTIENIQQIKSLVFAIDLSENKLIGLVGRNGIGKTTLIKAIKNLRSADTFKKTSSDEIFNDSSAIEYQIGDSTIRFTYDSSLASLNARGAISDEIRNAVDVELPIPYGQRFNFFQSISDADAQIRRAVVLEDYKRPFELIDFLKGIYNSDKFDNLAEIIVKGTPYYCIVLPESRYIREDYLSSGEYFLINLFRKIRAQCKLIVVDEIDISLDAAAQVQLIEKLRIFCAQSGVNILFSTHSLAMMQTLQDHELYHMREGESGIEIVPESYSFIRSTLFGFKGWDRYILTEDEILMQFLEYVIQRYCSNVFCKYKIIYIGTAGSVVDLMKRNQREEFFSAPKNVISILDGDQRDEKYAQKEGVHFLPFESVEKQVYADYLNRKLDVSLGEFETKYEKKLFQKIIDMKKMSKKELFDHLCTSNESQLNQLAQVLVEFLSGK